MALKKSTRAILKGGKRIKEVYPKGHAAYGFRGMRTRKDLADSIRNMRKNYGRKKAKTAFVKARDDFDYLKGRGA